ncbi:MAG: glycine--tRNA ligase subunit beta [Mariprofundaceae bacterium]|nr:glycine--tRNA ligase subunit beta [Mariprofundaceae bacterium]
MNAAPLLIEIGVEEIPAGVAPRMGEALQQALEAMFMSNHIKTSSLALGVTPRRLLIHADTCPLMQADREQILWGPPEKVAFREGEPTKAAEGFAKKSGLRVEDFELADKGDGKARYMKAMQTIQGRDVCSMIAEAMPDILRKLPSPKSMRWQDGSTRADAFIRPIRWIVARLGDEIIPFSFAGIASGLQSRGHRMCKDNLGEISVHTPFAWLEERMVIANRDTRKAQILLSLLKAASNAEVNLVEDDDLVEEVTDLTEWPHVITGHYDEDFLRLPIEVSRIELKHHQRCFSTVDDKGNTSNVFFAVANIKSKNPAAVAQGNERVVNARLADATFFYDRDPKISLEARVEILSTIVFQDGLGMVGDQVGRLRGFVLDNAKALGIDANEGQRAAYLCKSDLTTGLVGEFPELQGYMGGIYAKMDGENEAISQAIAEHYMPAGAADALPDSKLARAIGVIERMDKLLGYFHLGRIPTASADPFGLRRASIGLIRLLADDTQPIDMTLTDILKDSAKQWNQQRVTIAISDDTHAAVQTFIHDRLLGLAPLLGVSVSALDAALSANQDLPLYHHLAVARLLTEFADSEGGQAVAAANKRIANILKKAGDISPNIDSALFEECAEQVLFDALQTLQSNFPSEPKEQLEALASLRQTVDTFFDDVMVMADDEKVKANRLALLAQLRSLFLQLADVSKLCVKKH